MSVKTFLVELDTLLDTRIATVSLMDPKAAVALLKNGYRDRQIDDFSALTDGVINNADYRLAYENRDVETLKESRCTAMVLLLKDLVDKIEVQRIDTPFTERVVVEVNIHPYKLTSVESDALVTAVMAYTGLETEVKVVDHTLSQLTPTAIKDRWDAVILYDFNEWFRIHCETLKTVKLPANLMFAPALYLKEVPKEEDVAVEGLEGVGPFALLEMSMVERLKLELIEPRHFSLVEL